jgi:hypothetical protein
MTELPNGRVVEVSNGKKTVSMRISGGTAEIQMRVGDDAFVVIASTAKTADADFNIEVPDCDLKAVTTGTATVKISTVS